MKIAVYTVAKNEIAFAERWAQSAQDADYLVVADTGSTDGTQEALVELGVSVHDITVTPWRFDVARNMALNLVPADADVCVTLDMDEVLQPGWRAAVEAAWTPGTTRLHYRYVWSWDAVGQPAVSFLGERVHARDGYYWRHPVHETLKPVEGMDERHVWTEDMQIHHHPDNSKPRSQYLPLLELAVQESPDDDRCSHYLGRELMYYGRHEDAVRELMRHLSLPAATWKDERSASWRYIARCQEALGRPQDAVAALMHACGEAPEAREPWYELADLLRRCEDWTGGIWAAERCMALPTDRASYLADAVARSYGPYDVGSVCAWYAGQNGLAATWLRQALAMAPTDERLQRNAAYILGSRPRAAQ